MKKPLLFIGVLAVALGCVLSHAADITTLKGKKFEDITLLDEDLTHIKIRHSNGYSRIAKVELSPEIVKLLGISVSQATSPTESSIARVNEVKQILKEIKTKDGRVFYTSNLTEVTESDLKFVGNFGVVKVKFADLPLDTALGLGWNREASEAYDAQAQRKNEILARRKDLYLQAASIVDASKFEAKLTPFQKVRPGWLCIVAERKITRVDVETGRYTSALSNFTKIYMTSKDIDISGPGETSLICGLSDDFAKSKLKEAFSSDVFFVGKYSYQRISGDLADVPVYYRSREEAIRHLMRFGISTMNDESIDGNFDLEQKGPQIASGTGFFVSDNGLIATCHHVVDEAKRIEVFYQGRNYPAVIRSVDVANDLALVKIDVKSDSWLPIGGSDASKIGDPVFTIGFPNPASQGRNPKFTDGSISSLTGIDDGVNSFQVSVPIQPGNSGGPLVSNNGEVVGIITSTLRGLRLILQGKELPQNVNYAVKSAYLSKLTTSAGEVLKSPASSGKPVSPAGALANSRQPHIVSTENSVVFLRVELIE